MLVTSRKLQMISRKGFTLIEALVLLFIFSVVSVTFFQTYAVGTRLILDAKNRLGATALANQKMEIIRSIDYDAIGTKHWNGSAWVTGVPAGDILEDEDVAVSTTMYHVYTVVQYIDDSFDGVFGGSPNDAIPNDYKRVRLEVSWGDGTPARTVSLISTLTPNGIETSAGGGVLVINVLDSGGAGISGVHTHIVGSSTGVDTTTDTDATGNITLPATPASIPLGAQDYAITVSKANYYGTTTYVPYPTTTYDPVDEHISVVADTLNPITIVMDQSSDITLHTVDPFGTAIPNVDFSLVGGRILGNSVPPATMEYGFSQTTSTDASGNRVFSNESYGQYTLTVSPSAPYELYKIDPPEAAADILVVSPGVDKETNIVLLDTSIASAKIKVVNDADSTVLAGATVRLSNTLLAYDVTLTTDSNGFVYFPSTLPALTSGTYDIAVSVAGFADKTDTITIGSTLQNKTISLTAN